jgi:hypothetical protein
MEPIKAESGQHDFKLISSNPVTFSAGLPTINDSQSQQIEIDIPEVLNRIYPILFRSDTIIDLVSAPLGGRAFVNPTITLMLTKIVQLSLNWLDRSHEFLEMATFQF